ncbi:lipopolysaccharide biosynthesis protein [Paludibaculum fermentans]|uniref:lipopolysaccharide biosynthesis protein n=1 Tax=Paludibaculum fermentans TaxID=1473598 RepID=UPI003EBEE834
MAQSGEGGQPLSGAPRTRSVEVARNSLLYGLEMVTTFIASFITSIAIARVIGPEKLGYYNYVYFLTSVAGMLGTMGVPLTARKFMADYIGRGEEGKAKSVYESCWRVQFRISMVLTVVCFAAAYFFSERSYFVSTFLLIAGMPLRILAFLPAMANMSWDDMQGNLPGSFANLGVYTTLVVLSLVMGWGVDGIACGILIGYILELLLKSRRARGWMKDIEAEPLPDEMKQRMFRFSGQGVLLTLLSLTVFDRSDLVFLRMFNADPRNLTFFTTATSMVERLLLAPQIFTQGLGISILNDFGKGGTKSYAYIASALRYALLFGTPVLLCGAALSGPMIRILYGRQYLAVIPLFAVAAVLAIPKASRVPAQTLLQAHDRQDLLVYWGLVCAALNIILDLVLIPRHAAMGAVIANGVTQAVSCVGLWVICVRVLKVEAEASMAVRASVIGGLISVPVWLLSGIDPPWLALLLGAASAVVVGLPLIRWARLIRQQDLDRFGSVLRKLPEPLRSAGMRLLAWEAAGA